MYRDVKEATLYYNPKLNFSNIISFLLLYDLEPFEFPLQR